MIYLVDAVNLINSSIISVLNNAYEYKALEGVDEVVL